MQHKKKTKWHKRFYLYDRVGRGVIAEGVRFSSGNVALTADYDEHPFRRVEVYPNIINVWNVYNRGDNTVTVVWLDSEGDTGYIECGCGPGMCHIDETGGLGDDPETTRDADPSADSATLA